MDPVYKRLIVPVLIATIPVAAVGLKYETKIENLNVTMMIAIPMILFAIVLWLADRQGKKQREVEQVSRWDVMLMTLAQAVALVPGVSRSGITMTTGLYRGLTRETAVRLSFLLSIPVVGGPALLFAERLARHKDTLPANGFGMLAVGIVTSALFGYVAISALLKFVQSKSFTPFVIYRIILGVSIFGLLAAGLLNR